MVGGQVGGAQWAAEPAPAGPAPARRPGRGWYAVAGLVGLATVATTGALALARVAELVDRVDGYDRFTAPGGLVVEVTEPGHYGAYHEYLGRSGEAEASGAGEFALTVVAPDGGAVDVRPSDVTYGWGDRHGVAIGEFEAERPGAYQVTAATGYGQVAVGERMPGGLLRGFGGMVVAAYADRVPFGGDPEAAAVVADEVRAALTPLATSVPAPSPAEVQEALAPWAPDVSLSTNAVRTAGTAFAVGVDGGCVFGSVHDGLVEVEVGGYVNDGGCLAEYGH